MGKTHETDEMEIDLREVFFALKKRALIILAALVAGALIAGAYTKLLVTPMYSSTATMLVLSKDTTLTSIADLQLGTQLTNDYSVLLTSRPVLEEVIDNLGLDMGYGSLKGAITLNNPSNTRILEITVQNSDPELARDLVNELAHTASDYIGDKMEVIPPKVIEEGEVSTSQISPNTKKNIMLGALAGAVLAAGVVVLMSVLDDSIRSEDDIENFLGMPTLASVPDRKDYISGKTKKKTKKKRRRRKHK